MSGKEKLLVALSDGIKRITINRPERRNALDFETIKLLRDAVEESTTDNTRVVILMGAGNSFSAGADLAEGDALDVGNFDVTEHLRANANPLVLALRRLPVPVIARVDGVAAGIGCNFALACDIIIASERATFAELFIRIGLMPDGGGTFFLPRLVGYYRAFEMMATGESVSAQEAYQMGIVNRVVPVEKLDDEVNQLAAHLARSPRIALAKIKEALNDSRIQSDLEYALEQEAVNQSDCFRSTDFLEGVAAFLEKRKPAFGKN
jgi:2-(1,2-epoxy-1,2-dihydrophenyl)acetyl-CoA isomerase